MWLISWFLPRRLRAHVDPIRPYLNDNIVFWLMQDAGLLVAAAAVADSDEPVEMSNQLTQMIAGTTLGEYLQKEFRDFDCNVVMATRLQVKVKTKSATAMFQLNLR